MVGTYPPYTPPYVTPMGMGWGKGAIWRNSFPNNFPEKFPIKILTTFKIFSGKISHKNTSMSSQKISGKKSSRYHQCHLKKKIPEKNFSGKIIVMIYCYPN